MRALRELEPPSIDEGFAAVEVIEFAREPPPDRRRGAGVFAAAAALERPGWEEILAALHPSTPVLIFDWRPDGAPDDLTPLAGRVRAEFSGTVEVMICPHGGGPPRCWCRPPLPGLPLAFARAHGLDLGRCTLAGISSAHRTLAATLGARYVSL
jgi:hypothetical protein